MDLSGYNYTAPCVSILQSEGAAIKAASTAAETEAGTTYYTGEMTVYGKSGVSIHPSAYYTMSDFSSWGVPGDLEPEAGDHRTRRQHLLRQRPRARRHGL